MVRFLLGLATAVACLSTAAVTRAASEEIVVIVNKDNAHTIDRTYVAGLYTGRIKGWPDGSPAFTLDLGEAQPGREAFYQTIVGRSAANMRALWAQNIFAGRGLPPKLAAAGDQMKRIVAANRHAIGYIRTAELDDSVRALWR